VIRDKIFERVGKDGLWPNAAGCRVGWKRPLVDFRCRHGGRPSASTTG